MGHGLPDNARTAFRLEEEHREAAVRRLRADLAAIQAELPTVRLWLTGLHADVERLRTTPPPTRPPHPRLAP